MADYTDLTSLFTDTAGAIRALDGTTDAIKPVDFPERIRAINVETFGYTAESTLNITSGSYSCTVSTPNAKGYHNTQLSATLSPSDLGLTALGTTIYNVSTSNQTIAAGKYLTGAQTIRGVTTSGISAANIKDGTTIQVGDSANSGRIANVTGTFTDSATVSSGQTAASAAHIRSGYSAWVDGAEVKGSLATVSPEFDGGGLSGDNISGSQTQGNVSISESGTFFTSTGYGVTTTQPTSGTYLTVGETHTTSSGTATGSTTISRAAVLYNGAVDGYVSKADNTQALASGSKTVSASITVTPSVTNNFETYYMPVVSPSFTGGGVNSPTITPTIDPGKVTISESGTFVNSTYMSTYGITTTKPSGTDGTDYLSVNGEGSVTQGSVTGSATITRAAVTYNGAAQGAISKASGTTALAANSAAGTASVSGVITPGITDNFEPYYIPVSTASASATGGTASASASIAKQPSASTTASSANATTSYSSDYMTNGVSETATNYWIKSDSNATSGSASAASGYSTASASATGGSASASVSKGATAGASKSASGTSTGTKSATSTEVTASSTAKTASATKTLYLKGATASATNGTASITTQPSASTTASSASATTSYASTYMTNGISSSSTNYWIKSDASATSGSASANSGVITATGGSASVTAGYTDSNISKSGTTATTTAKTASSSAKTASDSKTLYLKAATASATAGTASASASIAKQPSASASASQSGMTDGISESATSYYFKSSASAASGYSTASASATGGSASVTAGYTDSNLSQSGSSTGTKSATSTEKTASDSSTIYLKAATESIATTASTTSSLTVTPSESVQYVNTTAGYTPLSTTKVDAISSKYVGSEVIRQNAATYNTSTTDQIIAAGVYLTGAQTFRGVTTSGISAENIKKGVNVNVGDSADDNRIAGVTGTFTSSSTVSDGQTAASAAQIRSGYSAWVDGAEVKGSLANGTITNNTTLPSGSTSSGTITDGSYIKIGAGYYSADKYYYAQNWAYKTNTPATIDVNDLTITPNALVGTWDSTNSKYVISQASKSTNSQSIVTTAGYISSTVGTKNTGVVTVSAPSNLELPASTWAVDTDGATSYTTLERGTTYKMTGGYYPYVRYYHTQPNPTLSGNASAANVLSGATFYNNSYTLQTGTMTNNGAVSATINTQGGTYTIPAGYHNGSGKITASITAGSATTPATTVPVTISGPTLNAKGIYMISVSGSKSITPSVTAGYISSGTAGTVSVSDSTSIATSTFASATLPSGQTATSTDYDTVYKISAGYNGDRYIQTPSYSTPYNAGYSAGTTDFKPTQYTLSDAGALVVKNAAGTSLYTATVSNSYTSGYNSGYSTGKTDYNPSTATLSNTGSLVVKNAAGTQIYTNSFSNSYNAAQTAYQPYSTHVDADGNVEVYNYAESLIFSDTTANSYNAGVASVTMETLGYTAETALSGSLSGTTYTVSTPQTKGYHSSQLTASVTPETLGLTARTSLSRMRNATKYTMTVSTLGTQGYYTSKISTDVSASDLGYTQNTAITITDMSDADNNTYYANVKLPNAHGYNSSDLSTDITPENLGLTELTSSDISYSSPYTIVIGQGIYTDTDTNFDLTAADITVSGTATSSPVVTPTMSSNNVNASTSTSSSYYIVVSGATTTTGSVTPKMTVDVPGVVDDAGEYTGAAIATSANVSSKTIYIPASDSSTSTTASGTTYATITPSTSVQYRNFTAGYTPAGNFKIAAISTQTATRMSQPNADTTLDGSTKPYSKVTVSGYVRGYSTYRYSVRATTASPTSYSSATSYYYIGFEDTLTVDSTTYYIWGTMSTSNMSICALGGEVFPTTTLYYVGSLTYRYRTSSTATMSSVNLSLYLYKNGNTLYILSAASQVYLPSSTYAINVPFMHPFIITKTTTSIPTWTTATLTSSTSSSSRYGAARIVIDSTSTAVKQYVDLPSTSYTTMKAIGYDNMYEWVGLTFYGSYSNSQNQMTITTVGRALTIG